MFKVKELDRQGPQRTPQFHLVKLQCTHSDGMPIIPMCFHLPHRNYNIERTIIKMTPLKISPYGPSESLLKQSVHSYSETLHSVPTRPSPLLCLWHLETQLVKANGCPFSGPHPMLESKVVVELCWVPLSPTLKSTSFPPGVSLSLKGKYFFPSSLSP